MPPSLLQTRAIPRSQPLAPERRREPVPFPRLFDERSRRWKRGTDIVVAAAMLIAALPLMAAIAIAILIESGRPVFFAHQRVGRGRKPFRLWKFRTMLVHGDAIFARYLEENPAAALEWEHSRKLRNDPRTTRVGRLLRRCSLDELPQLWNVLRGEMSMVGPRPIVASEAQHYGAAFGLYTAVAPGLTGLWQVSGRNDTSYRDRVRLDSEYVLHWEPILDAVVMWRTVSVVFNGTGAY